MENEKELNDRQLQFCKEYIIDFNATRAAIRAGYSEKTARSQGQRLLTDVDIQRQIEKEKEQRQARAEITADKVLQQLWRMAFADIREMVEWDEEETYETDEDTGEQIKVIRPSLRIKPMSDVDGTIITEIQQTKDGIKFKRADNQKALELLGKHLKLFVDKAEISGADGEPLQVFFNIPRPQKEDGEKE